VYKEVKNKELTLSVGSFLTVILIVGLLVRFNYRDDVVIQLHDTDIGIFPVYFALVSWVIFTFIIFLINGIATKFAEISAIWILLLANSILTILIVVFAGFVYAIFVANALIDLFRDEKMIDGILEQFNFVITTCIVLTILFLVGEIFLIKRVIKLRKMKIAVALRK
jgi:hypothetical protein